MVWKRQIAILFVAQLVIIACLDMSDPFWPLIIKHQNPVLNPAEIQYWSAAIYGAPLIVTIISTPFWSQFGEKIGHKKMILRAGIALALSQMLIGFVSDPLLILCIRLLQGAFAGFSAAAQVFAISLGPSKAHGSIISYMQTATATGVIIGPIIGGLIANYWGYSAIFFLSALICGIMVLILLRYLMEIPIQRNIVIENKPYKIPLKKEIIYLLSLISFIQIAKWMNSSFFALYVIQRLNGNNLTIGILYSSIALTTLLTASRWNKFVDDRIQQRQIIKNILVEILLLISFIHCLFAITSSNNLVFTLSLLLGIGLSALNIIPFLLLLRLASNSHKALLIGLANSVSKFGCLVGVSLGAFIQAKTNFTFSYFSIALVYVFVAGLVIVALKAER